MHTVELVSVRPYALTKLHCGNRSSAFSITGKGILPPPYDNARNVGMLVMPVASMWSTMRANIVGTTIACVTPSWSASSTQDAASNAGSCTMRRPA